MADLKRVPLQVYIAMSRAEVTPNGDRPVKIEEV